MGNPSLIAKLGIDEKDFIRGLNATEEGLARTQEEAKLCAAKVALLERQMAAGKTDALVAEHKKAQEAYRATAAEAQAMGRQLKALEAIKPPAAVVPTASTPKAAIRVAAEAAETAGGPAISRMGKMELGHVARSLAGSAAAGVPLSQSVMMEAPRLLSALGPALAGLLPVVAPLIPLFAGLGIAMSAHNANREASRQRRENDIVGSASASSSGQFEDVLDADEGQVKKTREARKKRHFWNKILGAGVTKADEINEQSKANMAAFGLEESLEGDADIERREFQGDPTAARDRLTRERDSKIAAAKNKHRADDEASVRARNALIEKANSDYALDADKLARTEADRQSGIDASRDMNMVRSEGRNVAVEGASIRAREAKEKAEHGPQFGPEHDENVNKANAASMDSEDAARRDRDRATSIAAEEQILRIKHSGLDVETRVAEKRLEVARATLANSREKTGAEYDALKLAVSAGQSEVEETKKATAEKRARLQLDERIASLRGSSAQVRQATLNFERGDIERQMKANFLHPDKLRELTADWGRNKQQQDELAKSEKLRSIDTQETEDRAHTGRGPEAQLALLQKSLDHVEERRDWNKKENGDDAGFNAGLDEKVHDLTQAIQDLNFTEQQRLTDLKTQNAKINQRGFDKSDFADSETDEKYDREKAEAQHRGAPQSEIDQIERNRADEHTQNAADEVQSTPAQKLERMRRDNARARAVGTVESTKARHDEAAAANAGNFDEFSGAAKARRGHAKAQELVTHARNRIDELKAGAANAGKGDGSAWKGENIVTAVNNVEKALGGAFKNR